MQNFFLPVHQTRWYRRGFTLLEVLVALAIFAVLALTGWKVFDTLIQTRERNQIYTERLSALQATYALMLRDFSQITARPARQSGQVQPALVIENNTVSFTRMGAFDPTGRSNTSLERVSYHYDAGQQQLTRSSYRNPDQAQPQSPPVTVLLAQVGNFSAEAFQPAPASQWPPAETALPTPTDTTQQPPGDARLPSGIVIQFTIDERPIRWVFSLVKKLPEPVPLAEQSDGQAANNTSQSNKQQNGGQ